MKAANDDLQMRSDWLFPICSGGERLKGEDGRKAHPTQKPEALLARILMASSKPGDLVLDPFFGSGTTGAVAKRLRRHFVGIEREQSYIDAAARRIAADRAAGQGRTARHDRQEGRASRRLQRARRGRPHRARHDAPRRPVPPCRHRQGRRHASSPTAPPARSTRSAPRVQGLDACNGWTFWHFEDETGRLQPIDALRSRMRQRMAAEGLSA